MFERTDAIVALALLDIRRPSAPRGGLFSLLGRGMPQDTGNLWLAKALWDLGAIQFGDYTIGRTTQNSPVYVNLRLLISNPRALARAARVMNEEVQTRQAMLHKAVQPFQRVCGIPFGGLHLATAYSLRSRSPLIYVHPAKERNGNRVFVEGRYESGENVLLIDDLVTSGGGHHRDCRVPAGKRRPERARRARAARPPGRRAGAAQSRRATT